MYSGAETNIIPTSLYNQNGPRVMNLQKPTMKLTAYGSCQVYVKGLNNPKPKVIQAEVVDVDGSSTIGNISAQSLNLLKLNWAVVVQSNSKSTSQSPKLFNARGKPYPLIKEYLLKEYQHVFTGIGCFPGPPYHIETNPDVSPVQHPPPTADSSPATKCLQGRTFMANTGRHSSVNTWWVYAMGQFSCGHKKVQWHDSLMPGPPWP